MPAIQEPEDCHRLADVPPYSRCAIVWRSPEQFNARRGHQEMDSRIGCDWVMYVQQAEKVGQFNKSPNFHLTNWHLVDISTQQQGLRSVQNGRGDDERKLICGRVHPNTAIPETTRTRVQGKKCHASCHPHHISRAKYLPIYWKHMTTQHGFATPEHCTR